MTQKSIKPSKKQFINALTQEQRALFKASIDGIYRDFIRDKRGLSLQEYIDERVEVRKAMKEMEKCLISLKLRLFLRGLKISKSKIKCGIILKKCFCLKWRNSRIYRILSNPLLQAQAHTKQAQQGQSNLTKNRDVDTRSILSAIEKTDERF